jgi:hypothetical protein
MTYTPPALPYYGPVLHLTKGNNLPINRIVIHYTAGSDATGAQGTARYFREDPTAGGSAHYITDSDESIQCAHDDVICWHAPPNQHSLGIEMECSGANDALGHWSLPNHIAMMHRTAKLTAQKAIQYGVPIVKLSVADLVAGKHGICGHVDVSEAFHQSTHTDPGPYFPWGQFMTWVHEEAALIGGAGGPIPTPPPVTGGLSMADAASIEILLKQEAARTLARYQRWETIQSAQSKAIAALAAQMVAEDAADDSALAKAVAELKAAIDSPPVVPAPKA